MARQSGGGFARVLPRARLTTDVRWLVALLDRAVSEFPEKTDPITSVRTVEMRKRGEMEGLVGLTTYCCVQTADDREREVGPATQTITFYSELLDQISDESALGVLAHELAHAWLNEHAYPEDSKERERQADDLARKWGYGRYLDALAAETDAP